MLTTEILQRLGVALAIGLLIGLERGWQTREEPEGGRAAGVRTHALAALMGGIWGAVALRMGEAGAIAVGLAFAVFSSGIILFRYRETLAEGTFGATTMVAAMLAFTLGVFAVVGDPQAAAASGVAATGLLALKAMLHRWIKHISWIELRSGLVLLTMTIILLPVLPNRTIDPWEAINPFEIWLMTVMIAALSFAGYIAIKLTDEQRGIFLSGVGGGLTSSTAVTIILSRLGKKHPDHARLLVAGSQFAGATMIARVLIIVAFLNPTLMLQLLLPLGLAGTVLAGSGAVLALRHGKATGEHGHIDLKNPFELTTVLQFGALLTLVFFLGKIISANVGNAGIYALAAVSGLADVDALTLSMARFGRDQVGAEVAARAVAIVVAVNSFAKAVLGWVVGGIDIGWRMMVIASLAILSGAAGFLLGPHCL